IKPISNTVEIFVTGLDAASLSFLASNLGLKSSTGNRYANEGISFSSSFPSSFFSVSLLFNSIWCMMFSLEENIWKRTASHICAALGVSLVWFSFWTLGLSPAFSSTVFISSWSLSMTSFSEPVSGNLGSSCSTTMCFLSRDQPLALDLTPFGFNMALRMGSAFGRLWSPSFFSPGDVVISRDASYVGVLALCWPEKAGVIGALGSSEPTGATELFLLDRSGSDFDFVILGCTGFSEDIMSDWMPPFSVRSGGAVVFTLWEADELLSNKTV
uniref:Uncharacterized protein n=1 Tax=Amphilophus citrinellus TaxID=61819 RepID=A0A3Q0S7D1_AMPCI